jgi:hypothetical protein
MGNRFLISAAFLFGIIISCSENKKKEKYLPDSNGRFNTISVVMASKSWGGHLGEITREALSKPYEGLPLDEAKFTLKYISPKIFTGFVRNSRSIIVFVKDSISEFLLDKNKFAKHQIVAKISGPDEEAQKYLFELNLKKLITSLEKNERQEKIRRIKKSLNNEKSFQKRFRISMLYPSAYKLIKDTTNFVWFQKEIPKGHLNIIAYQISQKSFRGSIKNRIIKTRDSIGKIYIPGRLPSTHMITEKAYRPYFYRTKIFDKRTYLTKGMWEVKNDFMAGPFINYMILDSIKKKWLVIEGFCFAPSIKKRDLMFELNTILRSVEFK